MKQISSVSNLLTNTRLTLHLCKDLLSTMWRSDISPSERKSLIAGSVSLDRITHSISSAAVEESLICLRASSTFSSPRHTFPSIRNLVAGFLRWLFRVDHLRLNDAAANQSLIKLGPERSTLGNRTAQHRLSFPSVPRPFFLISSPRRSPPPPICSSLPVPSSNCRRVRIPFGFWEGPFRGRRSRISIHAPQTAAEYTHFRQ